MRRGCRVKDDGHLRNSGNGLLEQIQALHIGLSHHQGESGDVAAWPREGRHMAAAEWVRVTHEYDRNRRGRSLGRRGVDGTRGHDDIDLEPDKFLRKFAHPLRFALRPAVFNDDIAAFLVTKLAKSLAESFKDIGKHVRTVPQETDAVEPPGLLRVRLKRPRGRHADGKRDEFASLHMPSKDHALYKHFATPMSALGQKRTLAVQHGMSALPPKADIRRRETNIH